MVKLTREPRKLIAHRILVPVKGEPCDDSAVRLACGLARQQKDARIFVVNVVEVGRSLPVESPEPAEVDRGESVLERMERIAKEERCHIETEMLQAREAGPAVVGEAEERGVDLIIMGLGYKRRHGEFDLGTTIPYVLRKASCRVWVARESAQNGPAPTEA